MANIQLESNVQVELLYSIYKEWTESPNNNDLADIHDVFVWMVGVKPFTSEAKANLYIDKVRAWMLIDFPNPKFRYSQSYYHPQWEVEIIGPFEYASQAGEFVDNLIANFRYW